MVDSIEGINVGLVIAVPGRANARAIAFRKVTILEVHWTFWGGGRVKKLGKRTRIEEKTVYWQGV
jgi:hypothetical protein